MSESTSAISFTRLLRILLPVLAIALAVRYTLPGYERAAQAKLESDMMARLVGEKGPGLKKSVEFSDSDGDLLCDPPADDECVTPETLVFSYVGGPDDEGESETWADLVTALGEATGLPAEYKHYDSVREQLAAMIEGELHVVGLNTGAIPTAAEAAGFHPVCTFGKSDGSFGYTMKLLVPAGGAEDIEELRGKRVAFTTPVSNSGFKAAMILLLSEHDMKPERDYQWVWSYGHSSSIADVAAGEHDAAPVASDILDQMIADGEIAEDSVKVLYESERFPRATIGFAHNLAPALRQQISESLLGFAIEGSSVAAKYGATGTEALVPVSFKDDWANIRRIDEAVEATRASLTN